VSNLSCIIVDDDKLFQKVLQVYVDKTDFLEFMGCFDSGIDAANFLDKNKVDILFLDIEMPEMSGLQLIKTLNDPPQIILVSGKEEYALDAFEYNVTDYLLKPVEDYSRFLKAVNRARKNLVEKTTPYIFVKEDSKLVKVDLGNILYLEAYGDYVKIHLKDQYHLTLSSLKTWSYKLSSDDFLQVHRSYIVRLDKIEVLEGNMIRIGKNTIPVSRSLKEAILKRIRE